MCCLRLKCAFSDSNTNGNQQTSEWKPCFFSLSSTFILISAFFNSLYASLQLTPPTRHFSSSVRSRVFSLRSSSIWRITSASSFTGTRLSFLLVMVLNRGLGSVDARCAYVPFFTGSESLWKTFIVWGGGGALRAGLDCSGFCAFTNLRVICSHHAYTTDDGFFAGIRASAPAFLIALCSVSCFLGWVRVVWCWGIVGAE